MNALQDKVCLVTGGTSGVGKSIALGCAQEGATVVIVSRDASRGNETAREMREQTGNVRIEALAADLSSLASVRELANAFRRRYGHLHVLSLNAASLSLRRQETGEGIESILAANYLGHFALTDHLLDLLLASQPSRVIAVSGIPASFQRTRLDMDDLMLKKGWSPLKATTRAALAKALFTFELARRMQGTGVTANTFHPGLVRSGLPKSLPWYLGIPARLAMTFFATVSRTGVYLATSPEVTGISGRLFVGSKPVEFKPGYDVMEEAARLWAASARLVGAKP
jgi:NAD(P)-dependent dehydrogenase (short-subunit alcohol dehydrogenase family)